MVKGGGGCKLKSLKNPGIDFYGGLRKNADGGVIRNPKNPGIDFYSGFRKPLKGGGVQFEILKKSPPP